MLGYEFHMLTSIGSFSGILLTILTVCTPLDYMNATDPLGPDGLAWLLGVCIPLKPLIFLTIYSYCKVDLVSLDL